MSDWKSRATPVETDWKSRATPVDAPQQDPELRAQLEAQEEGARGEGELNPANVRPDISPASTFFEHAGNKAGFGIVPALTGAATALEMKREGDTRPFGDIYRNAVQGTKQDLSRGEMLNPTAATAGKGAGIASTLLLPAGRAAQGLGAAARTAAGVGALYGGVGGLAGGKGLETLNPGQAALDAVVGAGSGAGTGLVLGPLSYVAAKGISSVARYIGGKLSELGDNASLKALGLIGSNFRTLNRQGLLQDVPEALRREGVIRPFSSTEANVERLQAAREAAGQGIETAARTVQSKLDAKLAEQSARLGSPDPLDVLQAGAAGIKAPFNTGDLAAGIKGARSVLEQTPGVAKPALNKFAEAEESVLRGGPQDMTLSGGLALKRGLQEQAKLAGAYNGGVQSQGQDAIRALASGAKQHVLEVAGQVPGGARQISAALRRSEPLEAIGDMAADRAAMQQGHSALGMVGSHGVGSAITLAGLGHPAAALGAGATAIGQKALRERLPSLIATAAPAAASKMEGIAQAGETPVARYIAGLLSSGTRRLSPGLEGGAGEAGDMALSGGGTQDPRHP